MMKKRSSFLVLTLLVAVAVCQGLRLPSFTRQRSQISSLFMATTIEPETQTSMAPKLSSAVKFSGSSGAALEMTDVCISIGNNDVMSEVNWTILPKERWALVGPK